MKKVLFLLVFCAMHSIFAQKSTVLFTVNNEPITVDEFKRVYEKNLNLVEDEDAKNIDSYLDLYINYKLKIKQAYDLKLDDSKSYQRELATYKNQLSAPYLQNKEVLNTLVKEAYNRTKNEVKAKHILVRFPKGMQPNDTLALYQKIQKIRKRVIDGEKVLKK